MTVTYFILWLIIFEVLLLGCTAMESHFKRHDKRTARKMAYQRRTNP